LGWPFDCGQGKIGNGIVIKEFIFFCVFPHSNPNLWLNKYIRQTAKKIGKKKMTTVETAKLIRKELATNFSGIKFSVRKTDVGVIYVQHEVRDLAFRKQLSAFLTQFENWFEYRTEYIFETN
jgi:hypothetical protein